MSTSQNTVSSIGDVLVIQVSIPILGLVILSSFIDNTEGEAETKYFEKVFRCSVDGITYTDWMPLNNVNLSNIQVSPTNAFRIEYRYQRSGTDSSGLLIFNDVTVHGTYQTLTTPDIYSRSIFAQFFDYYNLCSLNWSLNVLEKLYKNIIPKYIERGKNDNINWEDKDFLDFWKSITHFFSFLVCYVRLFESIGTNKNLLYSYLKSHDLLVNGSLDQIDSIYLMNNMIDEIRQRGTIQITYEKGTIEDESSSFFINHYIKQIDGELLRLISKKSTDEFIFCPMESEKIGWTINQSSPLYKGTNFAFNAIKGYEKSQDFIDLSVYPLINSQYCSLQTIDQKKALKIDNVPDLQRSGISSIDFNITKAIIISPNIDYEITFWINQQILRQVLTFGCKIYDINGVQINPKSIITNNDENHFCIKQQLNKNNYWYFVRCILFNKDESLHLNGSLDLGFGQHLKLNPDTVYLIPELYIDNTIGVTNESVFIWDFKVRPLRFEKENCFISLKNMIVTWMKNNSSEYSNNQVEEIMKRKLINYNQALTNNFI